VWGGWGGVTGGLESHCAKREEHSMLGSDGIKVTYQQPVGVRATQEVCLKVRTRASDKKQCTRAPST
jgi:hypothetical protein